MKCIIHFLFILMFVGAQAQTHRCNPHEEFLNSVDSWERSARMISNDSSFDVSFYHLDLEIAMDSSFIQGRVDYKLIVTKNGVSSIQLDLDHAFNVDQVGGVANSFTFSNNVLEIQCNQTFNLGDTMELWVEYHGVPALAGGIKGLRYEMHDGNEPIIASLSTPYLAHTWWPCKDGTEDKADSVFVDITIKDTVVNMIPVIAVSNGMLSHVSTANGKKTFHWQHRSPIVPYYVMVAISNYQKIQDTYSGVGYAMPLEYYVFDSHMTDAQLGTSQMTDVLDYFSSIFGPYPFKEEKYGMTQLGFYGGIENQTNSIVNNMGQQSFDDLLVHELAHQWFADYITCQTWNDGWLNEGFASYSEALYQEHDKGFQSYQIYMLQFADKSGGTIYNHNADDPFAVFNTLIYYKGAYVLHMLRGVMGDDDFFTAIYDYATSSNFAFGHTTTQDFQTVCENVSGQSLDYFFKQWIYDEFYPEYDYNFKNDPNGVFKLSVLQTQDLKGRRDIFKMPLEIKLIFSDGSDSTIKVMNSHKLEEYKFTHMKPVQMVFMDPNNWILKETRLNQNLVVGISELEVTDLQVYPNPGNGHFKVRLNSDVYPQNLEFKVYDVSGKLLFKIDETRNADAVIHLDLSHLNSGMYILSVESTTGIQRKVLTISDF